MIACKKKPIPARVTRSRTQACTYTLLTFVCPATVSIGGSRAVERTITTFFHDHSVAMHLLPSPTSPIAHARRQFGAEIPAHLCRDPSPSISVAAALLGGGIRRHHFDFYCPLGAPIRLISCPPPPAPCISRRSPTVSLEELKRDVSMCGRGDRPARHRNWSSGTHPCSSQFGVAVFPKQHAATTEEKHIPVHIGHI